MKPMLDDPTAPKRPGLVGVVRNPRSHRNKAKPEPLVESARLLVAEPASREGLAAELSRFAERRVDLIVVDGGDGTMRDLLTRGDAVFRDNWPRLMVLPKGKTNALAVDLGMPGRMTLDEALSRAGGARIVRRRSLRIVHRDGAEPPVFGFIMGTGVFNAAIDAGQVAHRFGAFQGLAVGLAAAFGIAMALIGIGRGPWRALSPTRIVTAEDGELPRSRHGLTGQRFGAGFSTLTTFPLGMKPFAGANRDGGRAIAFLAIDAPLRRVVVRVPLILAGAQGRHYPELGIHRGGAQELEIELGGRFILDGESFPPGAYRIGLGPELEFLVP